MKILLNTSINVQVNITYCIIIYNKMGKKVPNKNFKDQVFISLKQKSFPKKEKVEKPKKEKKTKEVAATTEEKPKKEKKAPAAKKSTKKEETVPEPAAAATQAPADDSDEIQTRIVTIEGGKQFLIDQDYNLYDINTHEEIGKFDPATQQPILA